MAEKSPSFSLYPKDFITDEHVVVMTMAQRGLYITLLCTCWLQGSIPSDPVLIGRLCGATAKEMQLTWPVVAQRFLADPTDSSRLRHKRLDAERAKQAKWREKSSAGGKNASTKRQPRLNHPSDLVGTKSDECLGVTLGNSKEETGTEKIPAPEKPRVKDFDWTRDGWDGSDFRNEFRALWDESGVAVRLERGCDDAVAAANEMVDPQKAAADILAKAVSWIAYYRNNGLSRNLCEWISDGEYLANPPKPQARTKTPEWRNPETPRMQSSGEYAPMTQEEIDAWEAKRS